MKKPSKEDDTDFASKEVLFEKLRTPESKQ